ncbi:MAG: PfkB family carbohydrate kinase [Puniceicoccales bacterium]|jgi:D-beta-D-heptose 7-phosphate kinase/D-beta-D-heptose 1-phosphate adenosyltransferase|nr:PfkB family carbohydrate kinase [Puniceicoccales bacterium]
MDELCERGFRLAERAHERRFAKFKKKLKFAKTSHTRVRMQSILNRASGLRALVFGDLMLDHYIIGDAHRLSPEAPVPIVLAREDHWLLGGAANVARNLAALGTMTEVAGRIGKDPQGDRLQNLLAECNILFDAGFRDSSVSTISKTRIVAGRQQVCRIDREQSTGAYAVTREAYLEVLERALKRADILILSDYAKGTLTQPVVNKVMKFAREQGCFIAADPKPSRPLQYPAADLLTPNAREALAMAGYDPYGTESPDWEAVCKKIYAKHKPKYLVITLGPAGMYYAQDGQLVKCVSTKPQEVYDVSGAGDTVIAVISVALAGGSTLDDAIRCANTAAGIVINKLGTAVATPSEIINALNTASIAR